MIKHDKTDKTHTRKKDNELSYCHTSNSQVSCVGGTELWALLPLKLPGPGTALCWLGDLKERTPDLFVLVFLVRSWFSSMKSSVFPSLPPKSVFPLWRRSRAENCKDIYRVRWYIWYIWWYISYMLGWYIWYGRWNISYVSKTYNELI